MKLHQAKSKLIEQLLFRHIGSMDSGTLTTAIMALRDAYKLGRSSANIVRVMPTALLSPTAEKARSYLESACESSLQLGENVSTEYIFHLCRLSADQQLYHTPLIAELIRRISRSERGDASLVDGAVDILRRALADRKLTSSLSSFVIPLVLRFGPQMGATLPAALDLVKAARKWDKLSHAHRVDAAPPPAPPQGRDAMRHEWWRRCTHFQNSLDTLSTEFIIAHCHLGATQGQADHPLLAELVRRVVHSPAEDPPLLGPTILLLHSARLCLTGPQQAGIARLLNPLLKKFAFPLCGRPASLLTALSGTGHLDRAALTQVSQALESLPPAALRKWTPAQHVAVLAAFGPGALPPSLALHLLLALKHHYDKSSSAARLLLAVAQGTTAQTAISPQFQVLHAHCTHLVRLLQREARRWARRREPNASLLFPNDRLITYVTALQAMEAFRFDKPGLSKQLSIELLIVLPSAPPLSERLRSVPTALLSDLYGSLAHSPSAPLLLALGQVLVARRRGADRLAVAAVSALHADLPALQRGMPPAHQAEGVAADRVLVNSALSSFISPHFLNALSALSGLRWLRAHSRAAAEGEATDEAKGRRVQQAELGTLLERIGLSFSTVQDPVVGSISTIVPLQDPK